jgi:hypothetical protein
MVMYITIRSYATVAHSCYVHRVHINVHDAFLTCDTSLSNYAISKSRIDLYVELNQQWKIIVDLLSILLISRYDNVETIACLLSRLTKLFDLMILFHDRSKSKELKRSQSTC